jgi:N-acetylmuramoyl-L-alanine amidase
VKFPRTLAQCLLLTFLIVTADRATRAYGAIISGAALESHGTIVELHFSVRGRQPVWRLDRERQQLAITLERTRLGIPPEPLAGREQLPVTSVRATEMGDGAVQLSIEVSGKVDYAIAFTPHDLIIRIAKTGSAPDIDAPVVISAERVRPPLNQGRDLTIERAAVAPRSMTPAVAPVNSSAAASATTPVAMYAPSRPGASPLVVIDPGHGGRDPGTRAADGIAEKDLALQIASRLQRRLAGLGVNARLTRVDDRFLSLAERTQAANRNDASLFISIHLNSSPDSATTGIETYYLNNTTDRATIRLARMENGVLGGYGASAIPNLDYILSDLRQEDKANESVALSDMIEMESVAAAGAALGVNVNNLGVRQGPFYVLVGAEMPAVLVECGFLSNPVEAERLADGRYQQGLADGIAQAVTRYLNGNAAVGNL